MQLWGQVDASYFIVYVSYTYFESRVIVRSIHIIKNQVKIEERWRNNREPFFIVSSTCTGSSQFHALCPVLEYSVCMLEHAGNVQDCLNLVFVFVVFSPFCCVLCRAFVVLFTYFCHQFLGWQYLI